MFKKLILFSTIAVLGGCETINQTSQCDQTKNYLVSNPQAMEEYKKLLKQRKIKSFYSIKIPVERCVDDFCVIYDSEKMEFQEKFFNDEERKGVYTISISNSSQKKECMKSSQYTINSGNKNCYIVKKNENNIVKSRYKYTYDKTEKSQTIISFYDMERKENLYEYSYQIYSTGAIGGPGFGTCRIKDNNPSYKFNPVSFPIDD